MHGNCSSLNGSTLIINIFLSDIWQTYNFQILQLELLIGLQKKCKYNVMLRLHFDPGNHSSTGPSPRNQKWSGGRSHRVLKAREEESTRGGLFPSRQGGWGSSPRIFLNFGRFYVRF